MRDFPSFPDDGLVGCRWAEARLNLVTLVVCVAVAFGLGSALSGVVSRTRSVEAEPTRATAAPILQRIGAVSQAALPDGTAGAGCCAGTAFQRASQARIACAFATDAASGGCTGAIPLRTLERRTVDARL